LARLEREDTAVPGWDAYAPTDVQANAERRAVRGEKRTFATRRASRCVSDRPGVTRASPERVRALKVGERLGHVRLTDNDGTCCPQRCDDLLIVYGIKFMGG
jgi:hypothetical protein